MLNSNQLKSSKNFNKFNQQNIHYFHKINLNQVNLHQFLKFINKLSTQQIIIITHNLLNGLEKYHKKSIALQFRILVNIKSSKEKGSIKLFL